MPTRATTKTGTAKSPSTKGPTAHSTPAGKAHAPAKSHKETTASHSSKASPAKAAPAKTAPADAEPPAPKVVQETVSLIEPREKKVRQRTDKDGGKQGPVLPPISKIRALNEIPAPAPAPVVQAAPVAPPPAVPANDAATPARHRLGGDGEKKIIHIKPSHLS